MARAAGDDAALGGGGGEQGAGLPGSQSGSGTRAARNGGTEATGAVRRFHPDTFHPSTSLFEFTSHEKLGDGKWIFFSREFFFPSVKYLDNGSYN
jgi:hypothetical protein